MFKKQEINTRFGGLYGVLCIENNIIFESYIHKENAEIAVNFLNDREKSIKNKGIKRDFFTYKVVELTNEQIKKLKKG